MQFGLVVYLLRLVSLVLGFAFLVFVDLCVVIVVVDYGKFGGYDCCFCFGLWFDF